MSANTYSRFFSKFLFLFQFMFLFLSFNLANAQSTNPKSETNTVQNIYNEVRKSLANDPRFNPTKINLKNCTNGTIEARTNSEKNTDNKQTNSLTISVDNIAITVPGLKMVGSLFQAKSWMIWLRGLILFVSV